MILQLNNSLGDHVILSGIPEAFYKIYGEKTKITSSRGNQYIELFKNNPYITEESIGRYVNTRPNITPEDYMVYYPTRVFYEITGRIVEDSFVQPNIYEKHTPEKRTIVVNDQAGWPSRIGYRYLDSLCADLQKLGCTIIYLRNNQFRDCFGNNNPETITNYHHKIDNFTIQEAINYLKIATIYIGYDSGLSSLAGAIRTPYVFFPGAVPAINTRHPCCIYTLDTSHICRKCIQTMCDNNCLSQVENNNEGIIERIKEFI